MPITTDIDANAMANIWKPFSERFSSGSYPQSRQISSAVSSPAAVCVIGSLALQSACGDALLEVDDVAPVKACVEHSSSASLRRARPVGGAKTTDP